MNNKQFKTIRSVRFKRFAHKSYSTFNSLQKAITIGVLSGCTLVSAHAASVQSIEKTNMTVSSDTISKKTLEEVVVTATKVDLPLNLATKQVTVLSSKDIERAPVKSVQDLLNYVAGVDLLQRGPHGVQADISLRGGSFDQAAILLNGINLTNPQTGHYSFDIPINLSDIERIEIVQGPSSLVYGAGAFSGGINIITKKDSRTNGYLKAEGGMHGLFGAEGRGAYKSNWGSHSLSAGYGRSDGYIANSDYKITNILFQNNLRFGNIGNVDVQMGYNDKKYGANTFYTAAYPNQYDDTQGMFASVKGATNGKLRVLPQLYWSRHYDCFQLIREGTPNVPSWYKDHNYHQSNVYGSNLGFQYVSAIGITSFGGELRSENILSSVLGKPMETAQGKYTKSDSRLNTSFYLEQNFLIDKFSVSLAALMNKNSATKESFKFYPGINASHRPTDNLKLYASWNKSTRMPSFTDLYYSTATHKGNPDLLPEYAQALEGGVKYSSRLWNADLAVFQNIGENLIDWIYNETDKKWYSLNLAKDQKLKTFGVTTQGKLYLEELLGQKQPLKTLRLGYQYLNQKNDAASEKNPISQYVFNYLRHKVTAGLDAEPFNNFMLSLNYRWQERAGSYIEYVNLKAGEKVPYKPFSILDIKATYQWRGAQLFVNANNVFDVKYIDLGNIPQSGFWLSGGLSYQF